MASALDGPDADQHAVEGGRIGGIDVDALAAGEGQPWRARRTGRGSSGPGCDLLHGDSWWVRFGGRRARAVTGSVVCGPCRPLPSAFACPGGCERGSRRVSLFPAGRLESGLVSRGLTEWTPPRPTAWSPTPGTATSSRSSSSTSASRTSRRCSMPTGRRNGHMDAADRAARRLGARAGRSRA